MKTLIDIKNQYHIVGAIDSQEKSGCRKHREEKGRS